MRWSDLKPDPRVLAALTHAGDKPLLGGQNEKRHWSESFANGCAIAIAETFRETSLRDKRILPISLEEGTEPLTPLGSGTSKRIDVTVSDSVLGLEIGVSLKGLNFRDSRSNNYDKNVTGRLYELGDEVRLVHEHLPHAYMVGVFFVPLASTEDKTERAVCSFSNVVGKLRERSGRLDVALAAHSSRCDAAYVALYADGTEGPAVPKGAARFFNVGNNPPRRGRPKVSDTMSLCEMVHEVVGLATHDREIEWADPEDE